MVTVHRAFGYRFVIFVNDHSRPHVHVIGHSGEAKITLDDLRLDWVVGIARPDLRRILNEAARERRRLVNAWERIHER